MNKKSFVVVSAVLSVCLVTASLTYAYDSIFSAENKEIGINMQSDENRSNIAENGELNVDENIEINSGLNNNDSDDDNVLDSIENNIIDTYKSCLFVNSNDAEALSSKVDGLTEKINAERTTLTLEDEENIVTNEVRAKEDSMFKIYGCNLNLIMANAGNVEAAIADKYSIELPIEIDGEIVSSVGYKKGKTAEEIADMDLSKLSDDERQEYIDRATARINQWYWTRTGNNIPLSDLEFITSPEVVAEFLISYNITEIDDVMYLSTGMEYNFDMLYFKSGDNKYFMPVGMGLEDIGVTERTLYTADSLSDTLSEEI